MQYIIDILIWLPAILIGLTFHEYAHGRVAYMLGDDTAYNQGRLTLNPLPHIDWIGFFMLIIFKFGWAKPVQVNPLNFNKNISIKQGMMLVSLAGPVMNILVALVGMIAYKYLSPFQNLEWGSYVIALLIPLIQINLILAAFNLIPVPPLDGSKILAGLLPDSGARAIYSLEQYGPFILILLIVTDLTGKIIWPLANGIYSLLYNIVF
ncbi:MAG TPA: site-2 protease family protein [Syntrophomonadaceae bacterium]|nr:site-2 protease family protein [Syntrophomonadaceae bacterium]HNX28597.1 site-2 protease family protein [Syntrophomonadaceae bacterium]HPR93995.1 site-2 protease family protein [Syntrophomonadaceae bacterium]